MALTDTYCDLDLATGNDDGTTEANAWQTLASLTHVTNGYGVNERVNVRGSESTGTQVVFGVAATDGNPIHFRGYTTTPGDGGRPTLTSTLLTANNFIFENGLTFEGIIFAGAPTTNGVSVVFQTNAGASGLFYRCKVTNSTASSDSSIALTIRGAHAVGCELVGDGVTPNNVRGADISFHSIIQGCYISSTVTGVRATWDFRSGAILDCLIVGSGASTTQGIDIVSMDSTRCHVISGNTIYNFVDGIECNVEPTVAEASLLITGNIFYTMSAFGIDLTTANRDGSIALFGNAYGDITTGDVNQQGDMPEFGKISLSADPFTNAGSDDFTLNDTAGGGALLREAKFPNDLKGDGTQRDWGDVGALQVQPAAGSGGLLLHPGMTGHINA